MIVAALLGTTGPAWAAPNVDSTVRLAVEGSVVGITALPGASTATVGVLSGEARYRAGYVLPKLTEIGGTVEFEVGTGLTQAILGVYVHQNIKAGDHLAYVGGATGILAGNVDGFPFTSFGLYGEGGIKLFFVDRGSLDLGGQVGPIVSSLGGGNGVGAGFTISAGLSLWLGG